MSSQKYISDTLKRRKQKKKKIKVYILLFLIVLFICGLIYVSRLPKFKITEVSISGLVFLNEEDIKKEVQNELEKKFFWLVPQSNIFIFPSTAIEKQLSQNPAIVSVKINKNLFNTIKIEVTEHQKQSVYCKNDSNTDCYYVNPEGMIYEKIDETLIAEQEIILYVFEKDLQIKENVLATEIYKNVLNFIKSANQLEIKINKVFILPDGIIEFETNTQTRLRASIFDDFEKDFTNFVALFEQNILQKDTLHTIEYIDLRFGNKVYYKNKTN